MRADTKFGQCFSLTMFEKGPRNLRVRRFAEGPCSCGSSCSSRQATVPHHVPNFVALCQQMRDVLCTTHCSAAMLQHTAGARTLFVLCSWFLLLTAAGHADLKTLEGQSSWSDCIDDSSLQARSHLARSCGLIRRLCHRCQGPILCANRPARSWRQPVWLLLLCEW